MSETLSGYFAQEDLDRIAAAVREAEQGTSGEIVPYIVEQSDDYEEAEWRGGALLASVSLLILTVIQYQWVADWSPLIVAESLLVGILTFLIGFVLVHIIPSLKRRLAGRALLTRRVAGRAAEAFITEEVFETRDRTGILIFVAILEHKVLVVGDAGINAHLPQGAWDEVVETVVTGLKSGRAADGLVDAVRKCGELLRARGVGKKPDDTNELRNEPRLRKR